MIVFFVCSNELSLSQSVHRISLEWNIAINKQPLQMGKKVFTIYITWETSNGKKKKSQSNYKQIWTFQRLKYYSIGTFLSELKDINLNSKWQRQIHLLLEWRVEITYLLFFILKSVRCKIIDPVSIAVYYLFIQKSQNL